MSDAHTHIPTQIPISDDLAVLLMALYMMEEHEPIDIITSGEDELGLLPDDPSSRKELTLLHADWQQRHTALELVVGHRLMTEAMVYIDSDERRKDGIRAVEE